MNIEIANRLVQMRKAHGYSQEELAEKLGISRQAVSKWERAESSPDTDNLIMLAKLYGVSLDELLGNDKANEGTAGETVSSDEKKGRDRVHVSFLHGIDVHDEDGSDVHIGWDGIRVNDAKDGDRVQVGADDDEDFVCVGENGETINAYIKDIEVDEDGVTFTENGERRHHDWNSTKDGKKRFVHRVQNKNTGKWRTTVISEDGHKVVIDTNRPISDEEIGSKGLKKGHSSGFPYAVLVTGVYLLLGFVWNLWHPAWVLFLTIPAFYIIEGALRSRSFNALDAIIPVAVTGIYVVLGLVYGMWHPLWCILFLIPLYYAVSIALRKHSKGWPSAVYSILVTAAYIILGCVFGKQAWAIGWLLFLTIPLFASIVDSIQKKKGLRAIKLFPWEVLVAAAYLFVGLMYGVWHPTWVAFLLIPVWRWLVNRIGGKRDDKDDDPDDVVDVDDD